MIALYMIQSLLVRFWYFTNYHLGIIAINSTHKLTTHNSPVWS